MAESDRLLSDCTPFKGVPRVQIPLSPPVSWKFVRINLKKALTPHAVIGFLLTSFFAVSQEWSLPEFCWSAWMTAMVFTWGCIVTAPLQIILTVREKTLVSDPISSFFRRIPPAFLIPVCTAVSVAAGLLAFYIYTYLFAFYGLFLSVFARMDPQELFGPNGFINSDFFTPVAYLLDRYWPMAAGVLIFSLEDLFRTNPWKRLVIPYQKEILRLHVMVLLTPFISLAAYALFREVHQTFTVLALLALLYFFPKSDRRIDEQNKEHHHAPVGQPGALVLPLLMVSIFAIAAGFYAYSPEYLEKLDFSKDSKRSARSVVVNDADGRFDSDVDIRNLLRRDHHLRGMTASEDGMTYADAPDGVFSFFEPTGSFDTASLILSQTYRKGYSFEIHKMPDGGRLIGFIQEDLSGQMQNLSSWSGFRTTIYSHQWSGATVLYCVFLNHLHPEYAIRKTKTDRGENILALEVTFR